MISGFKLIWIALLCAVTVSAGGCGSSSDSGSAGASMDQVAGAVDAQNAARKQQEEAAAHNADADRKAAELAAASQPPEKKLAGREAVAPGGYYKAIIGARRHVLNQVDKLPWLQAVQHFQATEGRLPKDHNEFMKKIVEPLQINLGYKEENQEFLYDPSEGQWGELYVVEKEPAPGGASAPK